LARAGQSQLFSRSTATSDSAQVTVASRSSDHEQGAVQSLAASPQHPAQDRVQWPDENPVLETPKAPKLEQAAEASSQTQIICIVRDPGQTDRVVTITQPSIALLQSIQQQAGR